MVVVFISGAPSNSTECHFVTSDIDIIANYCVTMVISSIRIQVVMSNCKERGSMHIYILGSIYIY